MLTPVAPPLSAVLVTGETPAGTVNGVNAVFTLAFTPAAGSLAFYYNGLLQESGAGNDFQIANNTITMASAPESGARLRASYRKV